MKILVGISGSLGALSIPGHLISLQVQEEVEELRLLMTPTAARFLNPQVLEALLRRPVHVDPWTDGRPMCAPPELVRDVDLFLIAPASATTLSRCATGSGETLLANCYLCHTGPVAFAPSMAPEMWDHPAVLRNLKRLKEDGALIFPPGVSYSAAAGTFVKGGIVPYKDMWPLLKSFIQQREESAKASL